MNERKNTQVSSPDLEMPSSCFKGTEIILDTEEVSQRSCPAKVFMDRITLNEGISFTNFYSTWVFVLYLGIIAVTYSTLEPQYLNLVLDVPDDEMGQTTAWLYLVDYSVRFIFALVYGPMIDLYGRKFVMTIGIVLVSLGYFLIPIYDDSLFPGYFITKCLTSCGLIALQMLPFAADYVHDTTKGVMAGMNFGIAFVGGVVGATVLKFLFWSNFSYKGIYWSLSAMIIIMGFIIRRGIKGGNSYYKQIQSNTDGEITDWRLKWKEIKKAFREIPWVPLSIIFGVLGNADIYIFTTGLVIWIKSLVPEGHDPTSVATNFQVVFFALSFFLAAAVALKIDKVSHLKLIFPILIVATLGFIAVPFVNSAYSPLLYIFFAIEGVSLPGVFVFSAYLSYRYNPPEIRGTLSGIGNGIGFLGAILILSVGGFLHDHWRKDASFLLYAGLLFFTLIAVTIISKRTRKYQGKLSNKAMEKLSIPLMDEVELKDIRNNLKR